MDYSISQCSDEAVYDLGTRWNGVLSTWGLYETTRGLAPGFTWDRENCRKNVGLIGTIEKKISKCNKIYFIASRKNKRKEIKNFPNNKLIKKIDKKKIVLFTY